VRFWIEFKNQIIKRGCRKTESFAAALLIEVQTLFIIISLAICNCSETEGVEKRSLFGFHVENFSVLRSLLIK
jgi:hypothetical protein